MFEVRNVGFLKADFWPGDSVTDYIFEEIRRRNPNWKANALHFLELQADNDFTFDLDGWEWETSNKSWIGSNCVIRSLKVNEGVTGLRMAFRYDD